MVGESNQNIFLIQVDASSFAEFEISEFEISRFDCMSKKFGWKEYFVIFQRKKFLKKHFYRHAELTF